jgi:lipopolysaccharide export system permease protein
VKTLHWYLLRQVLATLVMTVAVFTFVLLLGNLLKEVLLLLVSHRVTLGAAVEAIALLLPFVMVFALPMGLLTATLLAFGRFSADQELTAVRASGISLIALVTPVLLLSLVLTVISGWFSVYLAPTCRVAYKDLLVRLALQRPTSLLSDNQFIREFPGYVIYVDKVAADGTLRNVRIYQLDTNAVAGWDGATNPPGATNAPVIPKVILAISAPEAQVTLDPTNQQVTIFMPEGEAAYLTGSQWQPGTFTTKAIELPARVSGRARDRLKISEMTYAQLFNEYYEWRRRGIDVTPVAVQMHRQVAFPFACLGFTLVGIPLGVRAHRRETSAGIGMALLLVMVYWSFLILAQAWETYPQRYPQFLVWLPDFLFQGVGAALLWRANRRG